MMEILAYLMLLGFVLIWAVLLVKLVRIVSAKKRDAE